MAQFKQITADVVKTFLEGHDPMKHIVSIECGFDESKVSIVYINDKGQKYVTFDDFKPFLWCKNSAAIRLFGGDRQLIKKKMREYGISVKALITHEDGQEEHERLKNGFKYMFYANKRMSNSRFQAFFNEAGVPVRPRQKKGEPEIRSNEYITLPPVEQYMIASGRRLFKGWDAYDDTTRFIFDLETQGLNPRIHAIEQIGMRTNKGFEKILTVTGDTPEEKKKCELAAIITFVETIAELKPDVVIGHNSENFDWDFIIQRCEILGISLEEISLKYFKHPIFKQKRDKVLKLGGEVEYFKPTIIWGHTVVDSLHAVRRAQAIDSSFKRANLKYATKYLKLNKPNRVYVKGGLITETWNDNEENYAFNDENGSWYKIDENHPLTQGYEKKTGRYIVERYLLDDLWETDKVEVTLNEANFQVAKLLPTSFGRACTMGTAGIWKLIMLAWSYENNLAIPENTSNRKFVGGLSRLLRTGRVDRIVKLDYNSLYPSIILTWNLTSPMDITHIMNHLLDYVLTTREKYKDAKGAAGKMAKSLAKKFEELSDKDSKEGHEINDSIMHYKAEAAANDKRQAAYKVFGNSYFGAQGGPTSFPHAELNVSENTTCIGRQSLRLMIYHFYHLSDDPDYNYKPIVGDSVTGDTPLFIKYNDTGLIDIKPISEMVETVEVDALGREYDKTDKPYKVLCRSGWVSPQYVYRHTTDKPLYEVSEGDMSVTVTEDHSLFNDKQEKIKPSEINEGTKLEYYVGTIDHEGTDPSIKHVGIMAKMLLNGTIDRVPVEILNMYKKQRIGVFLDILKDFDRSKASKTCIAGLQYLERKLK